MKGGNVGHFACGSRRIFTHIGACFVLGKEIKTDLSKILLGEQKNGSVAGGDVVSRENLLNRREKIIACLQADRLNPAERGKITVQAKERRVSGRMSLRGEKGRTRCIRNWPYIEELTAHQVVTGGKAEHLSTDAASEQMQCWKFIKLSSGSSCSQ